MSELLGADDQLVVFDCDDTLYGTYRPIWRLHTYIAREYYGVTLTEEAILRHWGQPVAHLARHYYQTADVDQALEHIVRLGDTFPKETFDFTVPTLSYLQAAGKILGILSATTRRILADDTSRAGIPLEAFAYIQTGEETPYHKPDPRVFDPLLAWAAGQGIAKSGITYVGDSLSDMRAAREAGLRFIGVQTGLVDAERFVAEGVQTVPDIGHLV